MCELIEINFLNVFVTHHRQQQQQQEEAEKKRQLEQQAENARKQAELEKQRQRQQQEQLNNLQLPAHANWAKSQAQQYSQPTTDLKSILEQQAMEQVYNRFVLFLFKLSD